MTKNAHLNKAAIFLSLLFSFSLVLSNFSVRGASAETIMTEFDADANQKIIEESSKRYEEASERSSKLYSQIEDNENRINEIVEALPNREEAARSAIRELYALDSVLGQLINMILGIEDIQSAITNLEYIEHIKDKSIKDLRQLREMKSELETLSNELFYQKEEADRSANEAASLLADAQRAREEAQRAAQEKAERERQEAQERAASQEAQEVQHVEEDSSTTTPNDVSPPKNDGADWTADKSDFVNQWASRIDNYLSGSPLYGQGRTFASAAWDYGVDPRWSPAISYTESSKGANCFRSHNAWGWGSISWDSWEEAINAHIRGLARGYGYTISIEAAKKYCPPNWQHWYNVTSTQMNLI